jgi:hypothetical protein
MSVVELTLVCTAAHKSQELLFLIILGHAERWRKGGGCKFTREIDAVEKREKTRGDEMVEC